MIKAFAAFEPGGELKLFKYDPGTLGTGYVEIDVQHCGICHSDLSMLNNDWEMTEYPFVPGHEVIGKVATVGATVTNLEVGQTVGLGWHSGYCMTCHSCLSGDHNLCADATGTIVGRHGGFADKVRAHAASVIPLPERLDKATAGPLFCGGIAVLNPLVQFGVRPIDSVAVLGIGGLGHMALQFLKAWGCQVTAFTSGAAKQEEAIKLGAHDTVDSRDTSALKGAAGRFDLILSTVNAKQEGVELEVTKLDLLNKDDHAAVFRKYADRLDILVNNAAPDETGPIAEIPVNRVRREFDVNVFAPLEFTQPFARLFAEKGKGKIIFTSSIAGFTTFPFLGP